MSEKDRKQENTVSAAPLQPATDQQPNAEEILFYLRENGIINLDGVADAMKKKERKQIIERNHPYTIFQDRDGRWKTYVKDDTKKGGRRLIAKATKEKLEDALVSFYKGVDETLIRENMTLEALYDEWIRYKELHTKAKSYILRIQRDWKTYYEGTPIIKVPIRKLTTLQLDEWAHGLIKQYDMTNKQYYNCSVIMRQAMKYAVSLGIIEVNPFASVEIDGRRMFRHMKKPENETQVYSIKELKLLEQYAWEDYHHSAKSRKHILAPLAVPFQFQTGTRIGEVLALRYEDISEDGKWLHVQRFYRYETKEIVEHTKSSEGDR